jgi:hypothetical protein
MTSEARQKLNAYLRLRVRLRLARRKPWAVYAAVLGEAKTAKRAYVEARDASKGAP